MSSYPCIDVLLVVVLYMYIPLYILAQFRALESTVAISLKSAGLVLQSCLFDIYLSLKCMYLRVSEYCVHCEVLACGSDVGWGNSATGQMVC